MQKKHTALKKLNNLFLSERRKQLSIYLLVAAAIILAGFAVDAFCQRRVLGLDSEEKGTFTIDLDECVSVQGFVCTEDGYELDGEDGSLTIDLGGRYIDAFSFSYEFDGELDLTWQVWTPYDDDPIVITDQNSILIHTSVEHLDTEVDQLVLKWKWKDLKNALADAEQLAASVNAESIISEDTDDAADTEETVQAADAQVADAQATDTQAGKTGIDAENSHNLTITEISYTNSYSVNGYRLLFVWVVLGLAAFLWLGRHRIASHPELGFLVTALSIGLLIIVLLPANKVSWDEETHFFHTYCVAHFGTEVKTNDLLEALFVADAANQPETLPVNIEERRQMNETLNTLASEELTYSRGHALAGIYTPAYIPQAVGVGLGLLLRLPFTVTYQLGRVFNLLFCVLILTLAIRRIPVGKAILCVIGLLPTPLFLMSVYSYDAFITALICLGFAWFLDEYLDRNRKISWVSFLIIAACFTIGSMPKALYIPMLLVFLVMPHDKFRDRRQEICMKGIIIAFFLILMASFVLPTVLSPSETNDTRGGDTGEAGQITYILSDIPGFIAMIFNHLRDTLFNYTFGAAALGSVAHLGIEMLGFAIPPFVLLVIFSDEKRLPDARDGRLSLSLRLWTLLLCLGIMAMIWVAMYLAFTPVGNDTVNGVQARYYIPLLLPLYLCLCPDQIKISVKKETLYPLAVGGSAVITLVVAAMSMLVLCV